MTRRAARVVLVGRPNVGKSTLFNRIAGSRRAIVAPLPGTTRDAITQRASWRDAEFDLTDTGGMFGDSQDPLHALVVEQGRGALTTANLIIFLVDGSQGKVPGDEEIAAQVRQLDVPIILAINKADDRRAADSLAEFHGFGFESVIEISAEHGTGVAELLDEMVRRLPETTEAVSPEEIAEIGIAIVGRPNVGKSSLVNRLLREERVLVSEMPGTTRDAIDALLRWQRRVFRLVDTAGIRRAGRVAASGRVEATSVLIAKRAIERADVAVVVVDANQGVADQDATIAGEAQRAGRGIIIAVNKWDLVKGVPDFAEKFDGELRRQMKFLEYAPLVHLSALTGERVDKLLQLIDQVAAGRKKRVPTSELNRFVAEVTSAHPPASPGRKAVKILYATQTAVAPPTFVFFTNVTTKFHFSYQRFLENRLRDSFGFVGSPIRIHVRRT